MSTEAQIKSEIERLTASINQHKSTSHSDGYVGSGPGRGRGGYRGGYSAYGGYGSGGYPSSYGHSSAGRGGSRWMHNKYVRPGLEKPTSAGATSATGTVNLVGTTGSTSNAAAISTEPSSSHAGPMPILESSSASTSAGKKEVIIGGVAFESSARSLVRKDLPKPKTPTMTTAPPPPHHYVRKSGHLIASGRAYKPKSRRGRNLTLDNTRKSWRERMESKKRKYLNKPCPRFTTTGACNRGLTCMYQHDASKIAICWNFLQDNCPNTAETCQLSHDPTPERTPLCVHFLNKGRCTRNGCLFPHVNVGKREGVCRDFAVLGYCEKGLECDKQHVRECPDFAENGTCSTKGCKLPHVIRANRGRKVASGKAAEKAMAVDSWHDKAASSDNTNSDSSMKETPAPAIYAEDSKLGDEYISLTFHESEDEDEDEDEDESEGDEGEEAASDTEEEAAQSDEESTSQEQQT